MLKVFMIALLVLGIAFAQDEEGTFVEEDAHEHGAALLNVAQEEDVLSVEFISPAVNIVGFEYQPGTAEEEEMVETAITDLADGAALFAPSSAAECVLLAADVEGMEEHSDKHDDEEHGDEHGDEEHSDEDHDDEHGDEDHDEEHGDEHGDEDHDEEHAEGEEHGDEAETHSEFHATYEFSCENATELVDLELSELFTLYPGIEDLDVQYVMDSGQGAAELNAGSTQVTF